MSNIFETQDVQIDSAAQPIEPVRDNITPNALNTLGNAISSAGNIFTEFRRAETERKISSVATEFQQYKLRLANAVEQGSITSAKARTSLNSKMSQLLSLNPGARDELSKIYTQGGSASSTISEGNEREQMFKKSLESAISEGFVNIDASDQEKEEGVEAYIEFHKGVRELQNIRNKLAHKGELRADEKAELQTNARKTVSILARNKYVHFNNTMKSLTNKFRTGQLTNPNGSPATEEDALYQADQEWLKIETLVSASGHEAGSEYLNAAIAPMKAMFNTYKRYITREASDKALENAVKRTRNAYKLDLLNSNENVAKASAVSELIQGIPVEILVDLSKEAVDFMNKSSADMSDPGFLGVKPVDPLAPTNSEEGKVIVSGQKAMISFLKEGTGKDSVLGEEKTSEVFGRFLTGQLKGLDVYKDSVQSPEEYKGLRSFLASDEVVDFALNNNVKVDATVLQTAADVMDKNYGDVVIPLIQQKYIDVVTNIPVPDTVAPFVKMDTDTADIQSAVIPEFRGGSVQFKLNPTFKADSEVNMAAVEKKVKELNDVVSPIIKEDLRITAVLGNDKNLESIYNKKYAPLFEQGAQDLQEDGNLDVGNFSPLEQAVEDIKQANPEDDTQFMDISKNMNDMTKKTSGMFNFGEMKKPNGLIIHHTAGRGNVNGIVNVFKQRGFPAHFVIDREGKVHKILGDTQKGQHVRSSKDNDFSNSNSWGVEIIARDDEDVTEQQVEAAKGLAYYLNKKFGMPLDRVKGHGEVNTHKRKTEGKKVTTSLRSGRKNPFRSASKGGEGTQTASRIR